MNTEKVSKKQKGNNANRVLPAVHGKSVDRVAKCYNYEKYPEEWKAQYDMLLTDGITCKDCNNCERCCSMFGQNETATSCQFHPSRFRAFV